MQENHFRRIWDLGYKRLCSVVPPDAQLSPRSTMHKRLAKGADPRGKSPGVKWPDGTWSGYDFTHHDSTEADLDRWSAVGASVGVKTGHGLALIDADTLDRASASVIVDALQRVLGVIPPVRYGRAPKAGYLVRVEGDFQYARVEFGQTIKGRKQDRVEILYEGRQFVAHGIHPQTAKPYQWPQGMPAFGDVPVFPSAKLYALLAALRDVLPNAADVVREGSASEIDQASLHGDVETVTAALLAIPNTSDDFPTRESWIKVGYAVKAALPHDEGEAKSLWLDWSARWADGENDPEVAEAEWRRMKAPYKVGAGWLYDTAERLTGWSGRAAQWAEPAPESALFPENEGWANSRRDGAASYADSGGRARFELVPFDEAAATALEASAAPLIKGLLDQGAMTVLYGESNAGKTFVAMDLAYHVARGLDWAGMKTTRRPVVYVAAEGGLGARKRAAALMKRHGGVGEWLRYLLRPVDLLRADADLRPLIETLAGLGPEWQPGMIVIDTLSRAMAGGDENAPTDMGAMVRHLDVLRKATGAHVMVVHHSGKDRARGARGHSLLRAATDTEIEVADSQIAVTKQRDLDKSWSGAFELDVVELGRDTDGDPITSCVLRLAAKKTAVFGIATAKEAEVLTALRALEGLAKDGSAGAELADISSYMAERGAMTKEQLRFHLKSLLAKNLAQKLRRGRYSACEKAEENASSVSETKRFLEFEAEGREAEAEEDVLN